MVYIYNHWKCARTQILQNLSLPNAAVSFAHPELFLFLYNGRDGSKGREKSEKGGCTNECKKSRMKKKVEAKETNA